MEGLILVQRSISRQTRLYGIEYLPVYILHELGAESYYFPKKQLDWVSIVECPPGSKKN